MAMLEVMRKLGDEIYILSFESDVRLTKIHLITHPHKDTLKTMTRLISSSNCVDLGMLSRASV
jgi:hypothetical protein